MEDVSVVIPVGPNPVYRTWLLECIQSVVAQTYKGDIDILIVDDGANLTYEECDSLLKNAVGENFRLNHNFEMAFDDAEEVVEYFRYIHFIKTDWNLGVAAAFNVGVAQALDNLVFMLGSDDKLEPTCIDECVKAWEANKRKDAWYAVTIQYQNGQLQDIPCHASMVTKGLWDYTGGFPPSAGVGAPDALLLSILMKHEPERIVKVKSGTPLYWVREHPDQDTKKNAWLFSNEIISIRNKETERWKPKTKL